MTIENLRLWSQILLWISIILPILAALAVGARYYVEQYKKEQSGQLTATEIQQAKEHASFARSEVAEARRSRNRQRLPSRSSKVLLQNPLGRQRHLPL
jgi:hypothetical protein